GHKEVADAAVEATCTEAGLTKGSHCSRCKTVLVKQKTVAALGHEWDKGTITKEPTLTETGMKTYTCTRCEALREKTVAKLTVKTGNSYTTGTWKVKVTNDGTSGTGTVTIVGSVTKKSSLKSLEIPKTVKLGDKSFRVTAIGKNAWKDYTKLTDVTIGKYVTSIESGAFYNCSALTKVTIGSGLTKIGNKAFMKCSKLKTLTIKSKKLMSVGSNAVASIYKKAQICVPSSCVKSYGKLFTEKTGFTKNMIVKKY
ncbi:MAG: leucine-rich repeat domain-containing protein, partial [Clostridiales bacterium]|nr:leucine-rich repeat domain-containing protein [Clostridiales bacterium]